MIKNGNRKSTGPDQTTKILIVDDSPVDSEMLCDILGHSGYQIVTAEDGESALQQAEHFHPDLILLDVMLPGMDGFEICRRLKANNYTQNIPVIFCTSLDDATDVVRGFEVGAVDYIAKPMRYEEVLARVNTHLTIRKLQKELLSQNKRLQEKNTRQMWAQEALRESRERYRLLAEHSTDMISRLTAEGVYLYVSPACKTMLDYDIEELVGQSIYDFVHPQDVAALKEAERLPLERPEVMVQIYRTRRKDNSYVWVETTTKLIRYPKTGKILEIVAVTRDVSERKEAQEALEQANAALQISNKDLRIFSRTVAHDLKNPVAVILGYCDLWELKGVIPEELQKDVQSMRHTADKMRDIIESLLLLAGIRQTEIIPEPLDMAGIVTAAQERLAQMVAEYEAEIECPNEWPVALGYAPWIEAVWVNYLSNALKYGGQPPHVQLGATAQPGDMVQFWIQDNGPGLTAEEQAKLFVPFTRVDQRQVEGHGLGLSIVQHIAEKLGGQAGVEGEARADCKFYFVLPADKSRNS
jgi:PAS domain S-box-containing protein